MSRPWFVPDARRRFRRGPDAREESFPAVGAGGRPASAKSKGTQATPLSAAKPFSPSFFRIPPSFLDVRTRAQAESAVNAAEAARSLAAAEVARARAELAFASSELARAETLAKSGATSASNPRAGAAHVRHSDRAAGYCSGGFAGEGV